MTNSSLKLYSVPNIPLVEPGSDLGKIINDSSIQAGNKLENGDIIVIAQKIVSKAENRIVDLNTVVPSQKATDLAKEVNKDPRLVELILSESKKIVAYKFNVIIVEHHSGIKLANAGIDHSNIGDKPGQELVTLLPKDANASAKQIKNRIQSLSDKHIAVIITDSVGRPWRLGTVGIALGSAGILPLHDLRGEKDLFDEVLQVSQTADIDALASAAGLVMGEADNGMPVVIIRGFQLLPSNKNACQLLRPIDEDMFP